LHDLVKEKEEGGGREKGHPRHWVGRAKDPLTEDEKRKREIFLKKTAGAPRFKRRKKEKKTHDSHKGRTSTRSLGM